jgi:hypothetical protein
MLASNEEVVEIGGGLAPQVAALYGLPRLVTRQPVELPPASQDPHEIGRQWSSLLWDFRAQVESADSVVVAAHIKPRVGPEGPAEPVACYFRSLKNTAASMGVNFADWDDLAGKHGLAL